MSKRAFVPVRLQVPEPKPVRVAPRAPDALPEREPRNLWVMIGLPALVVALIGTIVMLYVSGVRSLGSGMFPMMGMAGLGMLMFSGRFGRARKISWGEQEKNRRSYLRSLDAERDEIQKAVCAQRSAQERCTPTRRGSAQSSADRRCGSGGAPTRTSSTSGWASVCNTPPTRCCRCSGPRSRSTRSSSRSPARHCATSSSSNARSATSPRWSTCARARGSASSAMTSTRSAHCCARCSARWRCSTIRSTSS